MRAAHALVELVDVAGAERLLLLGELRSSLLRQLRPELEHVVVVLLGGACVGEAMRRGGRLPRLVLPPRADHLQHAHARTHARALTRA